MGNTSQFWSKFIPDVTLLVELGACNNMVQFLMKLQQQMLLL